MSGEVSTIDASPVLVRVSKELGWEQSKVQSLKDYVCPGCSDAELYTFAKLCAHTGLDPFMKQIYNIARWNSKEKREVYTPQTSIDGLRLIADRTGCYAPGKSPVYTYNKQGQLVCAEAFVKKRTADGTWHEISATAMFAEYVQTYPDKRTGEKRAGGLWSTKPHVMLSKCAEAQALRKAFPAEMGRLYSDDEMPPADKVEVDHSCLTKADDSLDAEGIPEKPAIELVNDDQLLELNEALEACSDSMRDEIISGLKEYFRIDDMSSIPSQAFANVLKRVNERAMESGAVDAEVTEDNIPF